LLRYLKWNPKTHYLEDLYLLGYDIMLVGKKANISEELAASIFRIYAVHE
jgi:hypothetical protein